MTDVGGSQWSPPIWLRTLLVARLFPPKKFFNRKLWSNNHICLVNYHAAMVLDSILWRSPRDFEDLDMRKYDVNVG